MSEEYGFNVLNLKSKYDPHSYLLGRFYQTEKVETQVKLLHKLIMLLEDPDLEEIGIERDCLREIMDSVLYLEGCKTWPSYHYSDREGYYYWDGEKITEYELLKRERKRNADRINWYIKIISPIAIKIGNFLLDRNVSIPITIYGEPPKPQVKEERRIEA